MHQTHIILTLGRSGSNTLVDLLNQNPAILNYGEVLGEWNLIRKIHRRLDFISNNDKEYLDTILDNLWLLRIANTHRSFVKLVRGRRNEIKRVGRLKTVGFKEFSLNFDRYGLSDYVRERSDTKVLALTRSNLIERMVSGEFLKATGVVSSRSRGAVNSRAKLSIAPESVIEKLEIFEKEAARLDAQLAELDERRVFRIDYSDLYGDPDHTVAIVRSVFKFLGVDDMTPAVRMTKLAKGDPLASLENGDAVRAVIRQTRFAAFLYQT